MSAPKLVGLIRLPFPRVRKLETPGCAEMIAEVGVDVDGQAWGLVVRKTPVEGKPNVARLNYVRWVRFEAIAVAPDEVVTESEWTVQAAPAREGDE